MKSLKTYFRPLLLLLLLAMAGTAFGQVQQMPYKDYSAYGQFNIGKLRLTPTDPSAYLELGPTTGAIKGLLFPRGNKADIPSPAKGLVIFDIPTSKLVIWTGTQWEELGSTNIDIGTPSDSLFFSTRAWRQKGIDSVVALINQRVKYTDTSGMLFPYARKLDLDPKLNTADTSAMLEPYVTEDVFTGAIDTVVKYRDTTDMLKNYLRKDLKFIYPLHYSNGGDSVLINITDAWANAQRIQGKTFNPRQPLNGQVPIFNDTTDQWVPGYLDGDGSFFVETDSLAQQRIDSLLANWPEAANNNANIGSGHPWLLPGTQEIKTFYGTNGLIIDSTSNANALTGQVDSTLYSTTANVTQKYDILNASKLNKADSTGAGGYYPWSNPNNYISSETDAIADTRTLTVNAGNGVTISGTPTQSLGGTPSWTINADVTPTDVYADNLLFQPGYVTWSGTGLTFDVTAATYDIGHVRYNSAAGQITLDAADATFPRIDAIAVDNTGAIVKITGTAETNPVAPQVDPSTQVLLTTILLPAGATEPPDVGNDFIYDENTEWTSAAVGLTANFDNTANVYNGSKAALVSGFSNGQAIQWTNDSLILAANQVLTMQVRLSSNWNNSNNGSVMLMRGAVPISQALLITNYGLVKTNSGGYQTVSIPITAFNATDSFDRIRLTFIGNSGNDVYVDYVRFQSGLTTTVGSKPFSFHVYNGMTKVGADSAKLGGPVVEGTIFDMLSNYMTWRRKNNSNVNYTSAITSTGINWLAQYETDKQAEIISMATGDYSGTFAQMETIWGSNTTSVRLNGGTVELSAGIAGGDLKIDSTGQVKWPQYGNGIYTGTPAKYVAFDADGNMIEVDAPSGGGFTPTWGGIEGTLSNQTDLQTALDGKMDAPTGTATSGYVPVSNGDGTATWQAQSSSGGGSTVVVKAADVGQTTGTGAYETIASYTIPANTLVDDGDELEIEVMFETTTAEVKQLKLSLGGFAVTPSNTVSTAGYYVSKNKFIKSTSGYRRNEMWRASSVFASSQGIFTVDWTNDLTLTVEAQSATAGTVVIHTLRVVKN